MECVSPPVPGIVRYAKSGVKRPSRFKETMRKGQRGIPQGLTGSSLYSAAIHAPMVRNISRLGVPVHFGDNFYVAAKSEKGALLVAKALKAEFNRSPAGPLLLSTCIIKNARRSFAALGYIFKVKNGRATIHVPIHKLVDCEIKFLAMFDDIVCGGITRKDVVRFIDGWCAAHRLWPYWRLWRKRLIRRLDQHFPPLDE